MLLSFVVIATAVAVVTAFTWFNVHLGDGIGEHTYAPISAAAVQPSYKLGIGNLKVDLSQLDAAGSHRVTARVGIGELKIIVPRGADVRVDAHANAGDVNVFRRHDDGRNASVHTGGGTFRIDAKVGAGQIDVVRAP